MPKFNLVSIHNSDWLVFIAMAMFGGYVLFIRFFPAIPFLYFLFAFQVVGAISFGVTTLCEPTRAPLTLRTWGIFVIFAAVCVLNDFCLFWGYRVVSSEGIANVAFAHQLVSVFLLFLAPWLLGDKTTRNEWIALPLALLGTALLYVQGFSFGPNDLWGLTLGLASAFFYACIILFYRYLPRQGFSNAQINALRYGLSIILVAPFINSLGAKVLTIGDIGVLLAFGIFFAFCAVRLHTLAMNRSRPLHVSIIGKVEPVFVILYSFLFFQAIPGPLVISGGVLILGSSIWIALQADSK